MRLIQFAGIFKKNLPRFSNLRSASQPNLSTSLGLIIHNENSHIDEQQSKVSNQISKKVSTKKQILPEPSLYDGAIEGETAFHGG